jgi:glycine hydroxymethyltransferase
MAHFAGLIAGKVFEGEYDPVPFADIITSTTHKTLRGPRGGLILCTQEFKEYVDKGCPSVLGGPLPHVIASKCIAFEEAKRPDFCLYAQKIVENAQALADGFLHAGMRLVTGGTENHLLVVDVSPLGLTGRQAETALRQVHITCSRNTLPVDPNGAWYTSGIRLGTAALTTLGMGPAEMRQIAKIITKALHGVKPQTAQNGTISKAQFTTDQELFLSLREEVVGLLQQYPLYPEIVI